MAGVERRERPKARATERGILQDFERCRPTISGAQQFDTSHLDAIAIRKRVFGETHPLVAFALDELARMRLAEGNLEDAAASIREAMNIIEDGMGVEDPAAMGPMFTMAQTRLAQGHVQTSVWWMNRIVSTQEQNDEPFGALDTSEHARAQASISDRTMDLAITLHVMHAPYDAEAAQLAINAILRRKERALEARAQALSALRRLGPQGREFATELLTAQTQLAKAVVRGKGSLPLEEYRARISAMDTLRKQVEAQLGPRSLSGYVAPPRADVDTIRNAIPEGGALVEILLYRPSFDVHGAATKPPRYVAYVLRKNGGTSFADLGEAEPIDALGRRLRHALGDWKRNPAPLASALGARVMAPIVRLLGSATRVLVAPDGELSLVPLGALQDERGHWYLEQFEFTYLTSGRELIRAGKRQHPRDSAAIIAAPDFNHEPNTPDALGSMRGIRRSADFDEVTFPPLEHAEAEAHEIHEHMPRMHVFVGPEASEALIKRMHGPEILHLATHGFFLRDKATPNPATATGQREIWEDAFLQAGLAFAGANRRQHGEEDGVLTALEASALDLDGTKLVVLAGCETGVGEVQVREGVRGLRHAFLMAGAQTLVTSLWPIEDRATKDFMVAYYQALSAGQGRSEALRTASLAMMRKPHTPPCDWAGFMVIGDGSRLDGTWPPPPEGSWDSEEVVAQAERIPPGPRSCACRMTETEAASDHSSVWIVVAAGYLGARRRRGTCGLHPRSRNVTRG